MRKSGLLLICLLTALLFTAACSAAPENPAPAPPQAESAPLPAPEATAAPQEEQTGDLRISELMIKNRATLPAPDAAFYDWIELENAGAEPLSLSGWSLADGEEGARWPLPARELGAGERALVFAAGRGVDADWAAPFALSDGEALCLFSPGGTLVDRFSCPDTKADESAFRDEAGRVLVTTWPTPGFPNTDAGYEAFSSAREESGPLLIQEVLVANRSASERRGESTADWVELKNVSGETLTLSDFWLSDDFGTRCPLPGGTLQPGECRVFTCDADGESELPFSLHPQRDRLYLGRGDELLDYLALHDVPVDGSCGRLEGRRGFFYFPEATPGAENRDGFRMVTAQPEALTPDGLYDGVDSLSVALSGPGTIYYTTDGTPPGTRDPEYGGAVTIERTTVLRAFAVEEGKAPSRVLTLTYFLNEGHTLPVLSLVTDDAPVFRSVYTNGFKSVEMPATLALYEDGVRFRQACGVRLSGAGSIELPKKSLAIYFRGRYGDGNLDCDLFDSGVSTYASLQLRAGEAYSTTLIQSDLFQDICLDMSDAALTQHTKHCVLYVDGAYQGIFALKEKISKQYYASLRGVSRDSVTVLKYPVAPKSDFDLEVLDLCRANDLSDAAAYEQFCRVVDVDSLIDWYLVEGLSGNIDIGGNLRVLRSTENGGAWSFALYDLDWGFVKKDPIFSNTLNGSYYQSGQISLIMKSAMQNEQFRDRILRRYAEVWNTSLSNERFLAQIDRYEALLEPEIARERKRWYGEADGWRRDLDALRAFIETVDVEHYGVERFCELWDVPEETRAEYFGW